jgi:hypothetical protein
MKRPALSNQTRRLSAALLLLGATTTRCGCGDNTEPFDAPVDPNPPDPSAPVGGCSDGNRYRAPSSVRVTECDGTDNAGNPTMFPPGQELQIRPAMIRKCDDGRNFTTAEQFQIYWTVCNVSDNNASTLLPYQLAIDTVQNGTVMPLRTLNFTQPNLTRCDCDTISVVFNSSDPDLNKKLPVGTFQFRLAGGPPSYPGAALEQVTITNP